MEKQARAYETNTKIEHKQGQDNDNKGEDSSGDYDDTQFYVENLMLQPVCTSMATPTCSSNRRKRYLSGPSADSTIKKRKTILSLNDEKSEVNLNKDEEEEEAETDLESEDEKYANGNERRRVLKAKRELRSSQATSSAPDTEAVLKAVKDMQLSIDTRFDEMQQENKPIVQQLQEQIGQVRQEFNNRIDGLTEKVETKVTQGVKKKHRR